MQLLDPPLFARSRLLLSWRLVRLGGLLQPHLQVQRTILTCGAGSECKKKTPFVFPPSYRDTLDMCLHVLESGAILMPNFGVLSRCSRSAAPA